MISMNVRLSVVGLSVLLLSCLSASPVMAEAPVRDKVGIIEDLDLGNNAMIVQGMRYRVAVDVEVEINGSFGAFTMLQEGMQIHYTYRVHSALDREIVKIRHVSDNFTIEQV